MREGQRLKKSMGIPISSRDMSDTLRLSGPSNPGLIQMLSAQKGSWSLKKVLPVFDQDLAYDDLEVQSGMDAVIQFDAMIHAESQQQRDALYHDLRAYCERDTLATVQIHRKLCQLVG